jgi:cobalamin biosynthesis Mg chelatase CobN
VRRQAEAESDARKFAEERALAEASALAGAREREMQSRKFLVEAQARAAAEIAALSHAREREEAERNARIAAQAGAAADAEAVRLERQRRQVEALAAREAKERRRAEERAAQPETSGGRSYWPVVGAIAVAGIFAALGLYETTGKAPSGTGAIFQLKLDRNLKSFTQRLASGNRQ